jgi:hypothetical protein
MVFTLDLIVVFKRHLSFYQVLLHLGDWTQIASQHQDDAIWTDGMERVANRKLQIDIATMIQFDRPIRRTFFHETLKLRLEFGNAFNCQDLTDVTTFPTIERPKGRMIGIHENAKNPTCFRNYDGYV